MRIKHENKNKPRFYFNMSGCYGPRIYIMYCFLTAEVMNMMDKMSIWGGADKDTGGAKGWEFSRDPNSYAFIGFVLNSLKAKGFVQEEWNEFYNGLRFRIEKQDGHFVIVNLNVSFFNHGRDFGYFESAYAALKWGQKKWGRKLFIPTITYDGNAEMEDDDLFHWKNNPEAYDRQPDRNLLDDEFYGATCAEWEAAINC